MPNISLFERDLTTASIDEISNNVVYIPGYANMGPVNKPILCSTLDEFTSIFGSKPYIFKNRQPMPHHLKVTANVSDDYAFAGDYEKSYIYAAELLNNGLPVLFERIMLSSKLEKDWVAKTNISFIDTKTRKNDVGSQLIISAKNPGNYGSHISYKFNTLRELTNKTYQVLAYEAHIVTEEERRAWDTEGYDFQEKPKYKIENQVISNNQLPDKEQVQDSDIIIEFDLTKPLTNILKAGSVINGSASTQEDITTIDNLTVIEQGSNIALGSEFNVFYYDEDYKIEKISLYGSAKKNVYTLDIELERNIDFGIKSSVSEELKLSFDPSSDNYYANIKSELVDITLEIINPDKLDNLYCLNISNYEKQYLKLKDEVLETNEVANDEFEVADIYIAMLGKALVENKDIYNNRPVVTTLEDSIFGKLVDKGEYQIKFITSGSYPVLEYDRTNPAYGGKTISQIMMQIAGTRGDCTALIDHANIEDRPITSGANNLLSLVNSKFVSSIEVGTAVKREDGRKYGTMFTPWALYRTKTLGITSVLPGSYGYLLSLSESVKTNENWYAIAGVTRGLVPNFIEPVQVVTGADAEALQNVKGISVNPITMIKPYGYCIWGNRTLNDNNGLVASSFLNIRMLSNDVKKVVYTAAKKLTFELNNDILWLNFRSEIEPTLDKMVSGNGLSGYKVLRRATTKKATIEAVIKLYAIEAVEDWDIDIELADGYISVQ